LEHQLVTAADTNFDISTFFSFELRAHGVKSIMGMMERQTKHAMWPI